MATEIIVPDYYPDDPEFHRGYIAAMSSEPCEEHCPEEYLTGYKEGRLRLFLKIRSNGGRLPHSE